MSEAWKAGRGKLGVLAPLIGHWCADGDSQRGNFRCERTFASVLNNKFIQLDVSWTFVSVGPSANYKERAIIGQNAGALAIWSFTSDGERSEGRLTSAPDIHAKALCFESQMKAGLARQIYWPDQKGGVHWAVEAKSKTGWKRFTEHVYEKRGFI